MSEEKPLAEVIELLRKERAGMLTTLSDEVLVSRPTNVLDVDDDHVVWAMLAADSDTADQIRQDPRVCMTFSGYGYFYGNGTAEIVHDPARIAELWNPQAAATMQCESDDPKVALLKLTPVTIGCWTTASSPAQVVTLRP